MATAPIPSVKPRLEDPLNEREIFATEIAGVGAIHGNVIITVATTRFDEPIGEGAAKPRRVVAGRLILTSAAAGQLLQSLQKLVMQLESTKVAETRKR
jgi:hypothetical protein